MLLRQGVLFVAIGVVQLVVDWLVFSALFWLTGNASWTNVAGRAGAALAGYQLHGRVTFAAGGEPVLGRVRLLRYVVLWLTMTFASTVAMTLIAHAAPPKLVYLAKPTVELLLAGVSFLASRHWVFR
jgi:putative flippase GtrA